MHDLQQQPARVAGGKETRQGRGHHDRVAHQNISLGLAHGGVAPGNCHQANGAVELG